MLNKSFATNLIAAIVTVIGYISPLYSVQLKSVGLFALSGAITNWLAIHMLFEKIPLLYGSGVIPNRFEDFKAGIRNLMMEQFFTKENVSRFLQKESREIMKLDFSGVINTLDYEQMFKELTEVILASPFGGMLNMFGGIAALTPLKTPFKSKMKDVIIKITKSDSFIEAVSNNIAPLAISDQLINRVHFLVTARLNELTPQMVKEIIQKMIRIHLGWLVVWGGVFGGLIGLIMSFL